MMERIGQIAHGPVTVCLPPNTIAGSLHIPIHPAGEVVVVKGGGGVRRVGSQTGKSHVVSSFLLMLPFVSCSLPRDRFFADG